MPFIQVDPNVSSTTINLGDLGFRPGDLIDIKVIGDFSATTAPETEYHQDIFQTLYITYNGNRIDGEILLQNELSILVVNYDNPLEDNTDPDGDYGIAITIVKGPDTTPLFTPYNDIISFQALTTEQKNSVDAGEALHMAGQGNDRVILPNMSGYQLTSNVAWNPQHVFDAGNGLDIVVGGDGRDWIQGGNDSDVLIGGAGGDRLYGNDGNDKVYGDSGTDWVSGDTGNDTINGGAGNDRLSGSTGGDVFVFDFKLGTSRTDRKVNFDKITDFNARYDSLWLDNAVFRKLGSGTLTNPKQLNKEFFITDSKARERDDYLIYNKKTGVLSYDADGSGSKNVVEFAQLSKNLKLTYKDFFVI